jgi:hypothetical protein
MKAYKGEEVQLQAFLTLTVDGDECAASRRYRVTPGVVAPVTCRIRGWVGPRKCLEILKKR